MKPVLCVVGLWVVIDVLVAIGDSPNGGPVILLLLMALISYMFYTAAKDYFDAK